MNPDLASSIADTAQALALLVGGAWAYLHFVWARDRYPRVTLHTDMKVMGTQGQGMGEQVLAVVEARVRNHGNVRLRFRHATFTLRTLRATDTLQDGSAAILGQAVFPHREVRDRRFFPDEWEYTFVDAGGESTYRSVVRLPTDTTYALVSVRFQYEGDEESDFHADSVVVPVSSTPS